VLGVDAISLLDREFLGSSFSLLNLTQQVASGCDTAGTRALGDEGAGCVNLDLS
jgi:hypothetical protein